MLPERLLGLVSCVLAGGVQNLVFEVLDILSLVFGSGVVLI